MTVMIQLDVNVEAEVEVDETGRLNSVDVAEKVKEVARGIVDEMARRRAMGEDPMTRTEAQGLIRAVDGVMDVDVLNPREILVNRLLRAKNQGFRIGCVKCGRGLQRGRERHDCVELVIE